MMLVLAMGECGYGADEALAPETPEDSPMIVTEHELMPAMESNRQPLGPDPLVLPQWTEEEAEAMAAGRPTNLGGGLWTKDRYPLQPVPPWPAAPPLRDRAPAGVLPSDWVSAREAARLPPLEALQAEPMASAPPRVTRGVQDAADRHRGWLTLALLSLSALALAWAAGRRWLGARSTAATMDAAGPAVWLEVERPIRLGGVHSGGSGATMEW